jgi:arginine decarboxylase
MFPLPKRVFLTRGVGVHRQQLAAFEYALRDADIEQQNLVSVSSILPPQCELIPRQVGVAALSPGEITFCVLARAETNEFGRLIASGIGLARPTHSAHYGYISEHHAFGLSEGEASEYVEDLGIEFNPDAAWDERKRVYEMSNLIVDSQSIAAAAIGAPRGEWTCVVAAAVFLFSAGEAREP